MNKELELDYKRLYVYVPNFLPSFVQERTINTQIQSLLDCFYFLIIIYGLFSK